MGLFSVIHPSHHLGPLLRIYLLTEASRRGFTAAPSIVFFALRCSRRHRHSKHKHSARVRLSVCVISLQLHMSTAATGAPQSLSPALKFHHLLWTGCLVAMATVLERPMCLSGSWLLPPPPLPSFFLSFLICHHCTACTVFLWTVCTCLRTTNRTVTNSVSRPAASLRDSRV